MPVVANRDPCHQPKRKWWPSTIGNWIPLVPEKAEKRTDDGNRWQPRHCPVHFLFAVMKYRREATLWKPYFVSQLKVHYDGEDSDSWRPACGGRSFLQRPSYLRWSGSSEALPQWLTCHAPHLQFSAASPIQCHQLWPCREEGWRLGLSWLTWKGSVHCRQHHS